MSKLIDRLVAEAIFHKEKPMKIEKQSKITKALTEELEKALLEELKKKLEKKEKEEPKGSWAKMSVPQKLTILMITVPMFIMLELTLLLKFAVLIGQMVK